MRRAALDSDRFRAAAAAAAARAQAVPDDEVVGALLRALEGIFGAGRVPAPAAAHVTRWRSDPYARGAYSYMKVGDWGRERGSVHTRPVVVVVAG